MIAKVNTLKFLGYLIAILASLYAFFGCSDRKLQKFAPEASAESKSETETGNEKDKEKAKEKEKTADKGKPVEVEKEQVAAPEVSEFTGDVSSLLAQVTSSEVELSWTGLADVQYRIAYSSQEIPEKCQASRVINETQVRNQVEFTISELEPDTTYWMRVCAVKVVRRNNRDETIVSAGASIRAKTTPLPLGEIQVVQSAARSDLLQATIEWGAALNATHYLVAFREGSDAPPENCPSPQLTSGAQAVTLTGLKVNTSYTVRVCAASASAISKGVVTNFVLQQADEMPILSDLQVTNVKPTGAMLMWKVSDPRPGASHFYHVSYSLSDANPQCMDGNSARISTPEFALTFPFQPPYEVRVSICAQDQDNLSRVSSPLTTTINLPMPEIENLKCTGTRSSASNHKVSLEWSGTAPSYCMKIVSSPTAPCSCNTQTALGSAGFNSFIAVNCGTGVDQRYRFKVCSFAPGHPSMYSAGWSLVVTCNYGKSSCSAPQQ